jgi:hypothetical protein
VEKTALYSMTISVTATAEQSWQLTLTGLTQERELVLKQMIFSFASHAEGATTSSTEERIRQYMRKRGDFIGSEAIARHYGASGNVEF